MFGPFGGRGPFQPSWRGLTPEFVREGNGQRTPGVLRPASYGGSRSGAAVSLQLQVKTQCLVKLRHDLRRGMPEDRAKSLDSDRADLLGLGLGVLR